LQNLTRYFNGSVKDELRNEASERENFHRFPKRRKNPFYSRQLLCIFSKSKMHWKGTFIGVVQDFQIDEIKDPSPRLLECFGDHIIFAINTAQPHRYRAIEFFFQKTEIYKNRISFFLG